MSFLNDIFGSKPKVPELKELDLSEEQRKAIENNIKAAPEAARLSEMTADQIESLMRRTMPNFGEITGKASENIEAYLRGEVPKDVQEFIMRSDAAKALTGGYGATGMHGALTARDLGLTSLDLSMKGIKAAESWLAASEQLYAPAMATFASMFVTPMQQAAFDVEERNTQFQRSWLKNQIKAMPDPVMRGIHDTIMSLAVAYLGGSYQPDNAQQNYSNAGAGMNSNTGGWGGWGGGGGNSSFGQPITSPGMSYDMGGASAAPAGGSGFGQSISAPSVF